MNNINVAIVGSCVTRDFFEFDIDYLDHMTVQSYISRVTILSMMNRFDTGLIDMDSLEFYKFDEKKC